MKKIFYLFLLLPIVTLFVSCEKDNGSIDINPTSEDEYYQVSFDFGGDIFVEQKQLGNTNTTTTEMKKSPTLASASASDIYGINVYYDKEKDGTPNDVYAYGVFDNVGYMNIKLLSGHKYSFTCTLVKNGKNDLYYGQAYRQSYPGFCMPFLTSKNIPSMLENKFITGSVQLSGIKNGATHTKDIASPNSSNANSYANVDRYYGETTNYTPVDGGKVLINLKRTVFGAKFIIEGVREGTLTASCGSFWNKTTNTDVTEAEKIYSFPNVYSSWMENPITEKLNLSFKSSIGSQWDLASTKDIVFKRNMLTTVRIVVSPDLASASVSFSEESMDEDNFIDLEINSDGLIDTPVTPNNN
ncbi:MAG: hypothetical protein GX361_02220 [Bacteroidales bacterium]|nr:hypothetical protein [Bacteroidales bacterium]